MFDDDKDKDKDAKLDAVELMAELRRNTQMLRMSFEQHVEALQESAKLYHARYVSLLSAGFSEAQAMAILIQRGLA